MATIRVLLVDDHTLFREGMFRLLSECVDFEVVGEAANGLEALDKVRETRPDVVLMDVRMPVCNGVEATRLVKREQPSTNIVMLTMSEADDDLFQAVKAGAKGYLLKTACASEVRAAIALVSRGQAVVSPLMAAKLLREFEGTVTDPKTLADTSTSLTERETEILSLLASGMGNRQIAERICVAETTVRAHLRNILHKLHLQNRLQAVAFAVREGLKSRPEG